MPQSVDFILALRAGQTDQLRQLLDVIPVRDLAGYQEWFVPGLVACNDKALMEAYFDKVQPIRDRTQREDLYMSAINTNAVDMMTVILKRLSPPERELTSWFAMAIKHNALHVAKAIAAHGRVDLSTSYGNILEEITKGEEVSHPDRLQDIVSLALAHGARVDQDDNAALRTAVKNGKYDLADILLKHGADINACKPLLEKARMHGNMTLASIDFLVERGVPADLLTDAELKAAHARFVTAKTRWRKIARRDPPRGLVNADPALFYPHAYDKAMEMMSVEGYRHASGTIMAFSITALFGTEQRMLQYMAKWGNPESKQPLHDLAYNIQPPKNSDGVDVQSWADACLKLGPEMARLFKFADRIKAPEKSADGRTWSLQKTRNAVAQFSYPRAQEHPALAKLCFLHQVDEHTFNTALDLTQAQKQDIVKNLPAITLDGKAFGLKDATFHPLPANDIRGLFLGELTDCCQSIGGNGSDCARHGFTSENGGFYVVETAKGEIIGQTWAWRGKEGELVFDSLETLGERVSDIQWQKLAKSFASALAKDAGDVTALHIGTGGATPKSLAKTFNAAATPAQPLDYQGYRDSHKQIRVWARKP